MNKLSITFDEPVPQELDGKTFEEVFHIVRIRNHEIIEKIKKLTGNPESIVSVVYTPEVEKELTQDEIMYLRLAKMFHQMT